MAKYKFSEIAINSTAKKKPEENDKYTYIGLEHLDSQCLTVNRYGSEVAPIGEKLIMKKGDVLFGKRRAYQKKVAIAPFDGIFSAHGMVLRPNEKVIDKSYFPFFISSDYFLDAAIKISVGSLSPTINWRDLKELEFELPNIEEQRKLAKILWTAEKIKQKYTNAILNLEEIKIKYVKLFLLNQKDYVELKDIVKIEEKSKIKANDSFNQGKYKFYTCGQTIKFRNDYMYDGELILCSTGGTYIIKYSNGKCSYSTDVLAFKSVKEFATKYIYELISNINNETKDALFKGTGLKHLNKTEFMKYQIPNVSIKEQKKFIDKIEVLDKHKLEIEMQLNRIKQIQKVLENKI